MALPGPGIHLSMQTLLDIQPTTCSTGIHVSPLMQANRAGALLNAKTDALSRDTAGQEINGMPVTIHDEEPWSNLICSKNQSRQLSGSEETTT